VNTPPDTIDCAVIGAGVVGLTIAEELLTHGLSVCVIDRQQPGREASWAGAGILPPGSRYSGDPHLETLARISRPLNAALSQRIQESTGINDGYWECGGVYLASSQRESDELDEIIRRWNSLDIPTESLDACRLSELAPLASDRLRQLAEEFSAYHAPGEAQLRNPRRLKGLVALCQAQGASFVLNDGLASLHEKSDAVELRLTTGRKLHAGRVCVATGAWSNHSLGLVRQRPWVKPIRGQMLLLEATAGPRQLDRHLHLGSKYIVPRQDDRLLVGSTIEDVGFDKSTTAEGCAELLRFVCETGLGGLRLRDSWAGLRPASDDGLPLVGPAPDAERVYFATGHFRSGLQFAPATAKLIAQMMLGQPMCMDPSPFRIDR
jgi:glycine oxidase